MSSPVPCWGEGTHARKRVSKTAKARNSLNGKINVRAGFMGVETLKGRAKDSSKRSGKKTPFQSK